MLNYFVILIFQCYCIYFPCVPHPSLMFLLSQTQTNEHFFKIYTYISHNYIYIYYIYDSIQCCLYVYGFRTDHLELDNLSEGISLKKSVSFSVAINSIYLFIYERCFVRYPTNSDMSTCVIM